LTGTFKWLVGQIAAKTGGQSEAVDSVERTLTKSKDHWSFRAECVAKTNENSTRSTPGTFKERVAKGETKFLGSGEEVMNKRGGKAQPCAQMRKQTDGNADYRKKGLNSGARESPLGF